MPDIRFLLGRCLFRQELTSEPAPPPFRPRHGAVDLGARSRQWPRHPDLGTFSKDRHIKLAIIAVKAAQLAFLIHVGGKRESIDRRIVTQNHILGHNLVHLQRQTVDGQFQPVAAAILFIHRKAWQLEKAVIAMCNA